MDKKDIDIKEIIELSGIHPLKVRNVYVYGSQVYGYNRPDSDFDITLVAPNLERHKEIKNKKYNVHIVTPDSFKEDLFNDYKITYLECIMAPDWARLQEKINYSLPIVRDKLKAKILSQSFSTWRNAKQKMIEGDIERGVKSAFHSFKILNFGLQIAQNGKIINFAECNELLAEMNEDFFYEWYQIRDKYLSRKIELETKLKNS